jgi:sphinganine C4-monooxygenase
MNSTLCASAPSADECLYSLRTPWYYTHGPSTFPGISDHALSVVAPVVAYWALSLFFHALDMSEWSWLDKYRLHESAEVAKRNRASRMDVLIAVVFQQVVQTALGWWWLAESELPTRLEHVERMRALAPTVRTLLAPIIGAKAAAAREEDTVYFVYWWAIPVVQLLFAMYVTSRRTISYAFIL